VKKIRNKERQGIEERKKEKETAKQRRDKIKYRK